MKHIQQFIYGLLLLSAGTIAAAEPADSVKPLRPVAAAYTVEAGSSQIVNTYLTPLRYDGMELALRYERMQAMKFSPDK